MEMTGLHVHGRERWASEDTETERKGDATQTGIRSEVWSFQEDSP